MHQVVVTRALSTRAQPTERKHHGHKTHRDSGMSGCSKATAALARVHACQVIP